MIGILFTISYCALVPVVDSISKYLSDTVPLGVLVLGRFLPQLLILLPLIWWSRISMRFSRMVFWLLALRTGMHISMMMMMFVAFRHMPLADTLAIAFTMPFILLVFGWKFLNEEVGGRRLTACIVGFAGTLFVVQPSYAAVGAYALLPLIVAFGLAGFMLITRVIAKEADPMSLQAVGGIQASITVALIFWITDGEIAAFEFLVPGRIEWIFLLVGGFAACALHLCLIWSLRFAPSATLAPLHYLVIPFAAFAGWLVFGDLPNMMAGLGITMILAAGVYMGYREQQLSLGKAI